MIQDTIVSLSTALTTQAVSIIRLSGDRAVEITEKLIHKDLSKQDHRITYGFVHEPITNNVVDEVIILVMKGPRSYTREDIVEIQCHGGVYVTQKILGLVLGLGARLAYNGEFTQRAVMNGRIDLSQAESINELVYADSEQSAQLAIAGLKGSLKSLIDPLKEELLGIIAHIEVNIDYPEYEDVEELTADKLLPMSTSLIEKMNKIIEDSKNIKLLKEGIQTAIIGKPNVGKSSLLNAMLKEEKAIVTNIAGTTRDVVEGSVTVDGILLNMIDTAGIRETDNIVESLGVEKSKEMIKKADLVLLVIDGSKELDQEDQKLLELTEDTNRIIIINKADLGKKVDLEGIEISAKEQDILALTKEIKKKFNLGLISNQEEYYLTNARQTQLLEKAASSLQIAIDAMKMSIPSDLIVEDLYDSWSCLKEILGEQAKEDLLDELFKRFCIGK